MNLKKLHNLDSKKLGFISIIFVTLGVVFMNSMDPGSIGVVFIANGGLFLIFAMSKKKIEKEEENE